MHARARREERGRQPEKKKEISFVVPLPSRAFSRVRDHLRVSGVLLDAPTKNREAARSLVFDLQTTIKTQCGKERQSSKNESRNSQPVSPRWQVNREIVWHPERYRQDSENRAEKKNSNIERSPSSNVINICERIWRSTVCLKFRSKLDFLYFSS